YPRNISNTRHETIIAAFTRQACPMKSTDDVTRVVEVSRFIPIDARQGAQAPSTASSAAILNEELRYDRSLTSVTPDYSEVPDSRISLATCPVTESRPADIDAQREFEKFDFQHAARNYCNALGFDFNESMTIQSGPSDQRPRKLSPPTGTPAYNCNFRVCLWPRNSSFCEISVALTSICVCYYSPTLTYLLQLVKLIGTTLHSPIK
ncbi:alpha-mannosidase 2-like isoform X1, partial [Vespula squamosa]